MDAVLSSGFPGIVWARLSSLDVGGHAIGIGQELPEARGVWQAHWP